MSGTATFDLAVVGHGMVGAAAARHAAMTGARVALIGPAEQPRALWSDLNTFGAHFDEGRITRKTDIDPVWARLAARSIDRYAEIEEQSGIPFFCEVGHLTVSLLGSDTLSKRAAIARELDVREVQELSAAALSSRFPYLSFPSDCSGVFEPYESGHISARKLVQAQAAAAAKRGCTLINEEVMQVERIPTLSRAGTAVVDSDAPAAFRLRLMSGAVIEVRRATRQNG